MQEIRYELLQKLHEPVDLEQEARPLVVTEPVAPNQPHPSGLNRKQRRAKARSRA